MKFRRDKHVLNRKRSFALNNSACRACLFCRCIFESKTFRYGREAAVSAENTGGAKICTSCEKKISIILFCLPRFFSLLRQGPIVFFFLRCILRHHLHHRLQHPLLLLLFKLFFFSAFLLFAFLALFLFALFGIDLGIRFTERIGGCLKFPCIVGLGIGDVLKQNRAYDQQNASTKESETGLPNDGNGCNPQHAGETSEKKSKNDGGCAVL